MNTYVLKRNDEGFTYVEALLSLSVMSLIVMLTPSIMQFFNDITLPENDFDGDFFIIDIMDLNEEAEKVTISSNGKELTFKTKNGRIKYWKHNNRIVRSVDDKGFVTMMFNVNTFTLKSSKESYTIIIKAQGNFNEKIYLPK